MYLSRVQIDDANRQKAKDLSHLGAYHNWVENSFPNEVSQKVRLRHLWRIDQLHGRRYLLIVSQNKPASDKMEQYGVPNTVEIKDYQPFIDQINNNEEMRFRITANPTYRTNGKVYPHITVEQQKKWFLDRASKAGFKILSDENGNLNFELIKHDWPILYHARRVRLSRVTFEGILKVTDSNKFKSTLINGMGREKAYGMGMLTAIPLRKKNE